MAEEKNFREGRTAQGCFLCKTLCGPHIQLQTSEGIQGLTCNYTGSYLHAGSGWTRPPWYVCTGPRSGQLVEVSPGRCPDENVNV